MSIDKNRIKENLKWLRKNAGYTLKQAAQNLNLQHHSNYSAWESGASVPKLNHILEITRHFNLSLEDLVGKNLANLTADLLPKPDAVRSSAETIVIPIIGAAACGKPIFATEDIQGEIPISTKIAKPGSDHFLLRAVGDSMNKENINDGDLVLVKQQASANNGDIVVALIDDEATIKKMQITDTVAILSPSSTNPENQPIILSRDFKVQGIVLTSFSL